MPAGSHAAALRLYATTVSVGGLGLLAVLVARDGLGTARHVPAAVWLLAALLLVAQLFPLALPWQAGSVVVTTSSAFAFTLLLGWGVVSAMLALVIASIAADLSQRVSLQKTLFNAGQYSLSLGAAAGVYLLTGGRQPFGLDQAPAFVLSAATFFLLNYLLVRVATSLARSAPLVPDLRADASVEVWASAILFGMVPVALVVAEYSTTLIPLLLLPMVAVRLATAAAVEANERRRAAERVSAAAEAVTAEQRHLAEMERILARELQEQDRLKDDLLATVTHELRTPLTAILGCVATLRRRADALPPGEQRELMAIAERQGERLKALIEQLLSAARFSHADDDARPVIDAGGVVHDAGRAAQLAHPKRNIRIAVDGRLPVRAVPEAVHQVVDNLLDNAAKYSPDRAPIRLEAVREGALAVIAVEDSGPGVPAGERDRIFERFTRLGTGGTQPTNGVGIGLFIARQLARAERGELVVGQPPADGHGARFEFRLPLVVDEEPLGEQADTGAERLDKGAERLDMGAEHLAAEG